MKQPADGVRILPLGGLGEIGMNCMVLEHRDEIIVIDCGLMFSDLDQFGVSFVIPDFKYLVDRKDSVKALIMTHGHEDHIGGVPYLLKAGIRAPIYASPFTSLLLKERHKDLGLIDSADLRTFQMGETFGTRHFQVTPVSVNHSIVDAAALVIDTPMGKVIHTGDFRIDPTPFYGSAIDSAVFKKAGDEGVLLLMSDSTNVERQEVSLSENRVYQQFEKLFAAADGLIVVAMFASNVSRVGQILDLAKRLGKKVAVAGRSMDQNIGLGQLCGYVKDAPSVLISTDQIQNFRRDQLIVLAGGSQAELGSALQRISVGEHKEIQLIPGDTVLMSSRHIPGNEKAIGRMINQLFKQGADVLYESVHEIHASGHATRPELQKMLEWTRPKFFMPIHGEYRHLVHHSRLAQETGLNPDQILTATNNQLIELSQERFEVTETLEENRILIESREGNEISRLVLKERRKIGEGGIVFAMLGRSKETLKVISGPEIVTRGVVKESMEGWLIEEARKLVKNLALDYDAAMRSNGPVADLNETIRIELRRFFFNNLGKKPVVVPMILDV